ncbi:MAG: hypothetical protein WDO73_26185 [Ignavibacteriota bacterium]
MSYTAIAYRLPKPLRRHILHFEVEIAEAVENFARGLPEGSRLLDAGAGEGPIRALFRPPAVLRRRPCGGRSRVGLQPPRRAPPI